jgi:uroporphyrin-III C-methyltransferase
MRPAADLSPAVGGASLMVAWRLEGRRALVVGGGPIAAGRARLLLEAGAEVVVVATRAGGELRARAARGELTLALRPWAPEDLDGVEVVMAAIDDPVVSRQVYDAAKARRVVVNVADQPELCDVWLPAVHREGPMQIAVSSGGNGPSIAVRVRDELARRLPASLAAATERFGALRRAVRARAPGAEASPRRMRWLGEVGRTWPLDRLAALDDAAVEALADGFARGASAAPDGGAVRVSLVGAGPGDPDLLTEAARRRLAEADLVLADRLIPDAVLALAGGEVRMADKEDGRSGAGQAELERWMVEAARAGRRVVRLKIGDPFVFGRGGEELEALAAAGVAAEVVPGVSSALAAPAAAGIPTTLRGLADRVLVLTGQGAGGAEVEAPAWHPRTTYVVLMGVARAASLAESLLRAGFPADLPVAAVACATTPEQRVVRGALSGLAELVRREGIRAPATLVIGEVAGWRPGALAAAASG